ncbi:MAG: family containing protein [Betaproteobacteria bacterium]|nr:family containing protein [Betaproteobacteria bacterium]
MFKRILQILLLSAAASTLAMPVQAQPTPHVYELRTYTSHDGRLNDVVNRFRDHTVRIFARHGMVSVGYWVPKDQPNTLIYVLQHPSREAADKNWDAFRKDPEWTAARDASMKNGPIVEKTHSVFMDPTAFSALK